MAVDKRIPRILNSDADSKIINKVSMLDALNLYSGPDNEGISGGKKNDSGDGVLKNIRGTEEVSIHPGEDLPGDCRVIGSVEDVKNNVTYFFVYSNIASNQGVWAYDKNDIFNTASGGEAQGPVIRLVYKSNQFNFPQNGFVKGDIVYSAGSRSFPNYMGDDFDKDVIIYFTDGVNEPRRLNAYRAFVESDGSNLYPGDIYAEADFITACPKTPLTPINFNFVQDESRSVNNFSRTPGFQFAYQHIYNDGFESAISPYSDLAIPPIIIDQGADTSVNEYAENKCILTIPGAGPEIKSVRLMCRQGNTGSFLIIDELDSQEESFEYSFYNDRILKGVSTDKSNKQFDSIPRRATAQTVSSNRLMYANYVDGFDAPNNVTAKCTVSYKERPQDFLEYKVRYIPSVAQHGDAFFGPAAKIRDGSSFYLDFTEIPNELPPSTSLVFSLTISPKRNWHLYKNTTASQTVQRGPQTPSSLNNLYNEVNYNQSNSSYGIQEEDDPTTPSSVETYPAVTHVIGNKIFENHVNAQSVPPFFTGASTGDIHPAGGKIWGYPIDEVGDLNKTGVFDDNATWSRLDAPTMYIANGIGNIFDADGAVLDDATEDPNWPNTFIVPQKFKASCGTSAANPFIISGKPITFGFRIETTEQISQARRKLAIIASNVLSNPFTPQGYSFEGECAGIFLVSSNARYTYSFDLGLKGGDLIDQNELHDPKGDGNFSPSDPKPNSDKICAIHGSKVAGETINGPVGSSASGVPVGFFIVNKATATFGLRMMNNVNGTGTPDLAQNTIDNALGTEYGNFLENIGVGSTITTADNACLLNLRIRDLQDVEIHTCIHDTKAGTSIQGEINGLTEAKKQWVVLDDAALDSIQGTGINSWLDDEAQENFDSGDFMGFANIPVVDGGVPAQNGAHGYCNQIGRLTFNQTQGSILDGVGVNMDISEAGDADGLSGQIINFSFARDFSIDESRFISVMDGSGGPGGGPAQRLKSEGSNHPYDTCMLYNQGSVTVNACSQIGIPDVGPNSADVSYRYYAGTVFYGGCMTPYKHIQKQGQSGELDENITLGANQPTILPFLINRSVVEKELTFNDQSQSYDSSYSITPKFEYQIPQGPEPDNGEFFGIFNSFGDDGNGVPSVNFKLNQSTLKAQHYTNVVSTGDTYGTGSESFKSKANHSFGVVYYDERGRHGFVHPLKLLLDDNVTKADSQYVKAFGERTAGEGYGIAQISLELIGNPPEWAHSYKIVYGGNSTVQDFVQYTIGSAFVGADPNDVNPIQDVNKNIYLSLNYLQGHPVSYVSAFGARTPEGGLNFYKFEEGDKLNVISYGPGNERVYEDYEFDIVGLVDLGATDNPLTSQENPEENQKGQFVIVKDNPDADGFNHSSVAFQGTNNWEKNCVVELRTNRKNLDPEDQLYYEASDSFKVVKTLAQGFLHSVNPVVLTKGDVWFRRVATNVKQVQGGNYIDIITANSGADPAPQPNFTNVYLETESASDLFRSDSFSYKGRPNVIYEGEAELRREATVTYSDPSNPESRILNYSSFNASLANFKDLSEKYGDIQYIGDHNGYIYVIQKERISMIPTGKNVISEASGRSQLIASLNVLGEVITYPEVSGCDEDPSSVYDSGSNVYFCNKALSKVYRWTRSGGVEDISAKGLSSFIRAALERAINSDQVRVIGGFDPLKEEYLLSIQNLEEYETPANVVYVNQPDADVVIPDDDGEDDGPDTEGPSDDDGTEVFTPPTVVPEFFDFGRVNIGSTESVTVTLIGGSTTMSIEEINFLGGKSQEETETIFSTNALDNPRGIVLIPGPTNTENIEIFVNPSSPGLISTSVEFVIEGQEESFNLIDLSVFGQSVEEDPVSQATIAFTDAYNEFYVSDNPILPQEMSAQLAINYLIDLSGSPAKDQPTGNDIKTLLEEFDENSMKRLLIDYYGNNDDVVEDSTNTGDFLGLLGVLGDSYDPSASIYSDNLISTQDPPPTLSSNPPPNFANVEEAVQYLEQNKVLRVHDIVRLNKYSNPAIVLNVVNRFSVQIVNSQDLLAVLTSFNVVMNGMDSPYGPNVPTDYDTAEYTGSQVIDQIVTEFYDVITVEQYHRILNDQYPIIDIDPFEQNPSANQGITPVAAVVASEGAYLGYNGPDYNYKVTTVNFLFFLTQFAVDNGITLDSPSGHPDIL